MAVYKGIEGIDKLIAEIDRRGKDLIKIATTDVAKMIIETSPLGEKEYPTSSGEFFENENRGGFKDGWNVGISKKDRSISQGDETSGASAISRASTAIEPYNFQKYVYVTNHTYYALNVEETGWTSNTFRDGKGWVKDKPPYMPVAKGTVAAKALIVAAVAKAKKGVN